MLLILTVFVTMQSLIMIPIFIYRFAIKKTFLKKHEALRVSFGYAIILSILVTLGSQFDISTFISFAIMSGIYYLILRYGSSKEVQQ